LAKNLQERLCSLLSSQTFSPMSTGNADGDLYSDLVGDSGGVGDTVIRTQNAALKQRVREQGEEIKKLAKQVSDSVVLVAKLREENETLERNISCLYRTAVMVRVLFHGEPRSRNASSATQTND